ncbi:MAG: 50S ribosomal protein L28 [Anaerolineae bacterium]|nr:50S ribosomal protein L28 [Anaerolineae bacterium]
MAKCDYCGKTPMHGNSRSHSMKATKRQFKPNIQQVQVLEEGRLVSRNVCARCLKTLNKDEK